MSAKVTKKFAQAKLNHEMFKETLETSNVVRLENIKISTSKHQLQTACLNKIAFCAYDDERYINTDKKTTLPFGHFSLRDEYVSKNCVPKTTGKPKWTNPITCLNFLKEGRPQAGKHPIQVFVSPRTLMKSWMMLLTFQIYRNKVMSLTSKSKTRSFSMKLMKTQIAALQAVRMQH